MTLHARARKPTTATWAALKHTSPHPAPGSSGAVFAQFRTTRSLREHGHVVFIVVYRRRRPSHRRHLLLLWLAHIGGARPRPSPPATTRPHGTITWFRRRDSRCMLLLHELHKVFTTQSPTCAVISCRENEANFNIGQLELVDSCNSPQA